MIKTYKDEENKFGTATWRYCSACYDARKKEKIETEKSINSSVSAIMIHIRTMLVEKSEVLSIQRLAISHNTTQGMVSMVLKQMTADERQQYRELYRTERKEKMESAKLALRKIIRRGKGHQQKDLAKKLNISLHTLKTIMKKLTKKERLKINTRSSAERQSS